MDKNMFDYMRYHGKVLAFESRQLRTDTKKFQRKAQKAENLRVKLNDEMGDGEASPKDNILSVRYHTHLARAISAQKDRVEIRREARLMNLVVGFVRGKEYTTVENSVREGNEVDPLELRDELNRWGVNPPKSVVINWLSTDATTDA